MFQLNLVNLFSLYLVDIDFKWLTIIDKLAGFID